MQETQVQSSGCEDPLETWGAPHSRILAWETPWTEEPQVTVPEVPKSRTQLVNIKMGILSLLQGIFPTWGLNPGLPHCRWILYQLSHKGSPRVLEWVAYPFSRGPSKPSNQTRSPELQVGSLPTELSEKPQNNNIKIIHHF